MKVLRVFNNNVVLARDDRGGDVILTGRGLGYQARLGRDIDPVAVQRTFVPVDGRDPDHLAELLSGIPPEHIQLVGEALIEVGLEDTVLRNPALVIALADHVSFAVRRIDHGLTFEYPLFGEVKNLYGREYGQAVALLAAVNNRLDRRLPAGEAVALALHLVNAGFATGDLSYTYTMTAVISQLIEVIGQTFEMPLNEGSVSVGRFITHLRYLFVRIQQHQQLVDQPSVISTAIQESFPRAAECAVRLSGILELRLGAPLTADEISYLALHVARVAADQN
ncbi:MAG TPA: PRD domain-containing protein [Propionibacteriaceae bacterium]